uniref:Serpentine receptor class gamma n=1 Tax=Panagrellus redivivus TaxID=6233 RepID=A0A7E4VTR1_PANRE
MTEYKSSCIIKFRVTYTFMPTLDIKMETLLPTWVLCIQLAYGIPSLLTHFCFLWMLNCSSQKRHFASSFFTLTKILAIFDIINYIFLNLQNKLFLYGPITPYVINFPIDSWFYRIVMFGFYFCNYMRSCFVILESINRFVTLLFVTKQNKFLSLPNLPRLLLPHFVHVCHSRMGDGCRPPAPTLVIIPHVEEYPARLSLPSSGQIHKSLKQGRFSQTRFADYPKWYEYEYRGSGDCVIDSPHLCAKFSSTLPMAGGPLVSLKTSIDLF